MKSHRIPSPAILTNVCKFAARTTLLLLLSLAPLARLSAATLVYTGSTPPTLADGDTVRISGIAGSITLDGGGIAGIPSSLSVNEWVKTTAAFNFTANNVAFEQEDKLADSWAMLELSGTSYVNVNRVFRLTAGEPASNTLLTLDRVIIANGRVSNKGGGIYISGSPTTSMRINGDLALYHNFSNYAGAGGGGIATDGASMTFGGTVIMSGNAARYNVNTGTFVMDSDSNGGGYLSTAAGDTSVVTFEKAAFILSNTAPSRGGGIALNYGNSMVFEDTAVFINNRSLINSGGGIFIFATAGTAGTLTFKGDTLFKGNVSGTLGHGGAIYIDSAVIVDSTPDTSGAIVRFEDNIAARDAGGIYADTLIVTARLFSVTNNLSGAGGGGVTGGGLHASSLVLNSPFDISHNQAAGGNGRGAGMRADNINLNASGTIAANIGTGDGAGIFSGGNSKTVNIGPGVTIKDNISGGNGGGILINGNSTLSLFATGGDIVFEGNRHGATIDQSAVTMAGGSLSVTGSGTPNAIFFNAATPTLNLDASAGGAIHFRDPVEASSTTALTVNKTGAGSAVFDSYQSNIGSGTTTVSAGALELTSDAIYGSSTTQGAITVGNGAILGGNGIFRAQDLTLESGAILKAINGGHLRVEATNRNFASGFVLMGSGTITTGESNLLVYNITPGDGITAQTLTLADYVTLADGSVINIHLYDQIGSDSFGVSDRVNFSGTIAGGSHTIDLKSLQTGTFNLGKIGDFAPNLSVTINGSSDMGGRQHATLNSDGSGNLILYAGADYSRVLTWTGSNGTVWNAGTENWTDFGTVRLYAGGDRVVFSGTADTASVRSIEVGGSQVSVSDMWIEGSQNYAFTGTAGIVARSSFEVKLGGISGVANPGGKLVMRGSGTLTFGNSAANIFSGGIDIHNGTIVFGSASQLGTEGAPITFKGTGALSPSANGITLANAIVVEAGNAALIQPASNQALTLSGSITGSGTLRMDGPGALLLAGDGKNIGSIHIASGTLLGDVASLTTGIANNAALQITQTTAAIFTGTVTGSGVVTKAGAGKLTLNDGAINAGTFTLDQGEIALAAGAPIKTTAGMSIASGAILSAGGSAIMLNAAGSQSTLTNRGIIKVGRAAGASGSGQLTINGNLASESGNSVALDIGRNYAEPGAAIFDRLAVTGTLSGTMNVVFNQSSVLTENTDFSAVNPVTVGAFAGSADVISNFVALDNGTETRLRYNASTKTIGWTTTVVPGLPALLGADVSSILVGRAVLDSLSERLQTARAIAGKHAFELWFNGLYSRDKINASYTRYEGSHITTYGAQTGADWTFALAKGHLTFGVHADLATADMDQDGASVKTKTNTESTGFGAYASYRIGAWYVNALARRSGEDYEIDVPDRPRLITQGSATAASLEVGTTYLDSGGFLNWEPQLQITYQTRDIDNARDYIERIYAVDSADSIEGRFGVRLWLDYELKPGWRIRPYLRVSFAYEFEGGTNVHVEGASFDNSLRGRRQIFDLGAVMQLGKHINIGASASIHTGEITQGVGCDLTASFRW